MELKRRNEQITEIPLTVTRKYSSATFAANHEACRNVREICEEDVHFCEVGTRSFTITGIGRIHTTTFSNASNELLKKLKFMKSMHFLFLNARSKIAQKELISLH